MIKQKVQIAIVIMMMIFSQSYAAELPENEGRPNFVFLLVDDLGWADVGCFGSSFYETPNIDKLAKGGMKFTDAYAACPVCSPTRNSILSGRYPARTGHTNFGGAMKSSEFTLAEALKEGGYSTFFAGKWHLGHDEQHRPEAQGFEINKGGCGYGQPPSYFFPYHFRPWQKDYKKGGVPMPGLEHGEKGEYLTDRLTEESLKFLDDHGRKDKPFLLYLSYYTVHTPLQTKDHLAKKYEKKAEKIPVQSAVTDPLGKKRVQIQSNPVYAGMIETLDHSVGDILDKLDELGIAENTMVIFMSDNGGLCGKNGPTSNLPLRAGKGTIYEGGIREPLIIRWPEVIKPSSVCSQVVTSTDFYPTMLSAAGLPLREDQHQDGINIMPLLEGEGKLERDAVYWHYPHKHGGGASPCGAIRSGDYKLIEYFGDGEIELYNLKEDIGENTNLVDAYPDVRRKMLVKLKNWQKNINPKIGYGNGQKKKIKKDK